MRRRRRHRECAHEKQADEAATGGRRQHRGAQVESGVDVSQQAEAGRSDEKNDEDRAQPACPPPRPHTSERYAQEAPQRSSPMPRKLPNWRGRGNARKPATAIE